MLKFLCRSVGFLIELTLTNRRGALERDDVEQYSSRPARKYRTEGESRRAA